MLLPDDLHLKYTGNTREGGTGMDRKNARVISNLRKTAIRLIALTICVFLITGSVFSMSSAYKHMSHKHERIDHFGSNMSCTTCAYVIAAEKLLRLLFEVMAGVALICTCLFLILALLKPAIHNTGFTTLIHQKIRFNN